MIIESYGYKFLRLNRFNLGAEPVAILSKQLYTLIGEALKTNAVTAPVAQIQADAASLETKEKKRCPECETIRDVAEFWDASLETGRGGYGRNCIPASKAAADERYDYHVKLCHQVLIKTRSTAYCGDYCSLRPGPTRSALRPARQIQTPSQPFDDE